MEMQITDVLMALGLAAVLLNTDGCVIAILFLSIMSLLFAIESVLKKKNLPHYE